MAYIAKKPCNFRKKKYAPGEVIDDNAIMPYMARRLLFNGIIAEVAETGTEMISIPILKHSVVDSVDISVEDLLPVMVALQGNAQESISAFAALDTEEQRILFCALEGRKSVSNEVEKMQKEAKHTENQEEEGEA